MLRKWEDIRNEGIEGVLPTTGSTPYTARICLQEKFVKFATIFKDECSAEEIKERIRDIAFNAMAKSAICEDIYPPDRAYGGFKKRNVCAVHNIFPLKNSDLSHLFVCALHFAAILIHVQVLTCRYWQKCCCLGQNVLVVRGHG
jgi:hypothetical protein